MDENFGRCLKRVLRHEGGWSDNPNDKGGATMKGVTLATFRATVKPKATKADLRAITDAQLETVYYKHYWAPVHGNRLPAGVDYAVFDFAVNSGTARAARFLQACVGVAQDGKIGPATLAAVARHDPADLVARLCSARLAWLRKLKDWRHFGRGWENRVTDVLELGVQDALHVARWNAGVQDKPAKKGPTLLQRFFAWLRRAFT